MSVIEMMNRIVTSKDASQSKASRSSRKGLQFTVCYTILGSALVSPLFATSSEVSQRIESILPPPPVRGCVLVTKDGQTVFKKGFGALRVDGDHLCTSATNFRMASILKQFTATSILLLVDRGELKLNAKLGESFTESPAYF